MAPKDPPPGTTDERIQINFDDLNGVADQLDGYADALESAHGEALEGIHAAIDDDVRSFTRDDQDSPLYAGLKTSVHTACENEDKSIKAIIINARNYAKFFREVASTHANHEELSAAELSKIQVPDYKPD